MMKCPKCGFEQPKEVFCANCGVNMQTYKQPIGTIVSGLGRSFRSFLIIVVILIAAYFLLQKFEKIIHLRSPQFKDTDITDTTQLGVGAGSLATEGGIKMVATPNNIPEEATEENSESHSIENKATTEEKKFNQVSATFIIGEALYAEFFNEQEGVGRKWHVVSQMNPLNTFLNQEMPLKKAPNTFAFDDEVLRIDMVVDVSDITDKDVQAHITYHRAIRGSTENESITADAKIPINQYFVINDPLPRRMRLSRVDTILSTLFQSQAFMSRSSEMVQIIKLENPRNVPQE
jgi:hypothetical protein